MVDILKTGEILRKRTDPKLNRVPQIESQNKQAMFVFQTDGNLVLSMPNGKILWSTKTNNRGPVTAKIQPEDGNFVLSDARGKPVWASATRGKNPILKLQNDGNLVMLVGTRPIWSTDSNGFKNRQDEGGWLENVGKTAGRAFGSAINAVAKATGDIGKAIGKVPLVGPLFHSAWSAATGPFQVASDIASGKRLDRVMMDHLKREVSNVKEAAPYAQMVISVVPGIGPIASAAIGTGLALANGQSIDKALIEGAKSALPGGPLAKAAFDVGQAAMEGKKVGEIGLAAVGGLTKAVGVPVPKEVAGLISTGMNVAQSVAAGKPIDKALINEAIKQLPNAQAQEVLRDLSSGKNPADVLVDKGAKFIPGLSSTAFKNMKTGLGVGMAMGQAQKLQQMTKNAVREPKILATFTNSGMQLAKANPVINNARKLMGGQGLKGFDAAIGVMKTQAGPQQIMSVREALSGPDRKGFDMGVSLHTGMVTMAPPKGGTPTVDAGYFITRGMMKANSIQKGAMMEVIAENPEARAGAKEAIVEVAHARQSWFDAFLEFIGLGKPLPKEGIKVV